MANAARAHLLISGRVQGVFYRAFTRDVAERLGLGGWVSNLSDGRVEAVFEGDRPLIEQAAEVCRKGPSGARVTGITVSWDESPENLSGFSIRY